MTSNTLQLERRAFRAGGLRAQGMRRVVMGHAAVFNTLSHPETGFREKIVPGAFVDTIARDDVRALWNHNPENILARTKPGFPRYV